ncbi:MAG: C-GCAxxG-C-C family protein [Candidatus Aminicenantes bacterium]|nr:C-GCAxxG-C-C family protein [Candidatus Aminicenantes bacterium]
MAENPRVAKAAAVFEEGFSCSQAVFLAFAEDLGLERETALRLSQAFGGGMAHLGEACGAVTGAFMALSLKHGRTRADDLAARDRTYERMRRLADRFKELHGSLKCPTLIGVDLATPEGMAEARDRGLFRTLCAGYVRTAAELVDELL